MACWSIVVCTRRCIQYVAKFSSIIKTVGVNMMWSERNFVPVDACDVSVGCVAPSV